MKKSFISALVVVAISLPLYAELPEKAKDEFATRFQKSKSETGKTYEIRQVGTVLVTVKEDLPAALDRPSQAEIMPIRPDQTTAGPQASRRGQARVHIRNGKLSSSDVVHDLLLPVGTLLGIVDIDFAHDSIVLWVRTLTDHEHDPEVFGRGKRVAGRASSKIRFYVDPKVLKAGDLPAIYRIIEEWVRPYDSMAAAEMASREIVMRKP
ncbi:MAG: hypothetical protein ACR2L2_04155 [Acidobacteriota bacterium]